MADIRNNVKRYPTDLTDLERSLEEPLMPPVGRRGRLRKTDLREVVDAFRHLVRSGCGWETLPKDFSLWQTVF